MLLYSPAYPYVNTIHDFIDDAEGSCIVLALPEAPGKAPLVPGMCGRAPQGLAHVIQSLNSLKGRLYTG